MEIDFKYRGVTATTDHVVFIKKILQERPEISRRALSIEFCQYFKWVQPNGFLRDLVCRKFMIRLEEAGYINLPARKQIPPNNLGNRIKPTRISIDQSPIHGKPSLFPERKFEEVKRTPKEKLFNSLIDEFHYLCYSQLVGEHLKYILFLDERPVSCIAFSSSPLHIGCRDRFIGWSKTAREKNRHLISYNTRFLILPWVSIKNLASFIFNRSEFRLASYKSISYDNFFPLRFT